MYDREGLLLACSVDRDGDGTADWLDTYVHDEETGKIRIDSSLADLDGDGSLDGNMIYDTQERMVRLERDRNNDGELDYIDIFIDLLHPPIEQRRDNDFDGNFEIIKNTSGN